MTIGDDRIHRLCIGSLHRSRITDTMERVLEGLAVLVINFWKKQVLRWETVGSKTAGVEPIRLSRSTPGISEWARPI